jgi:hypothetical protein
LGIGAMAALNTINVIQGKPTISPQLMLGLINRSGELEDIKIDTSAQGATCVIKRRGRSAYTAKFGPAEAAAMGLNGKDNYKKQAATMYKWRAVADACRATFADVLLGLYTPDEMGATTDVETGEIVETTPDVELRQEVSEVIDDALTFAAVRNVKLEGVQPQPTKPADILLDLNRTLGYTEAQLLKWLIGKFTLDGAQSLSLALNALTFEEISQAIDIFREKVERG